MFASRHPLPRPKKAKAPPRARYVLSIVHKHRSFASTTFPEKEEEEEEQGQEQEQGRHGDPHCVIPLLLLPSTTAYPPPLLPVFGRPTAILVRQRRTRCACACIVLDGTTHPAEFANHPALPRKPNGARLPPTNHSGQYNNI